MRVPEWPRYDLLVEADQCWIEVRVCNKAAGILRSDSDVYCCSILQAMPALTLARHCQHTIKVLLWPLFNLGKADL